MTAALIFGWTTIMLLGSSAPPADETSVAIQANLSLLRDVEFVFEGQMRQANVEDKPEIRATSGANEDYQGTYAFRLQDAATYLDVYRVPLRANVPLRRQTKALLASKLESIDEFPDVPRKDLPVTRGNGGAGSFNSPASPEPFFQIWRFREILLDPASYHYETQGLEEVDGHACRKIKVNEFYRYDLPDPRFVVYWIDLERGGLPLKIEYIHNGVVTLRTHKIRLQSFRTPDGQTVWLALGGETGYFDKKTGEVAGQPFVRETRAIVPTSVRINQGLNDAYFSVRRDTSGSADGVIKAAQRRFATTTTRAATGQQPRTDPKGIREKLAANLAVADRQAKEIEASSVARESSRSPSTSTILIAVAAAVALIVALLAWRRR